MDLALLKIGLNTKERNDFVTYWIPELEANSWNLVEFLVNSNVYNSLAQLCVEPAPDTILRVFMLFKGIPSPVEGLGGNLEHVHPFNREGFTVVEWGGMNLIH